MVQNAIVKKIVGDGDFLAQGKPLLRFVGFRSRSGSALQPEQLFRMENGLYTVRSTESTTRTM